MTATYASHAAALAASLSESQSLGLTRRELIEVGIEMGYDPEEAYALAQLAAKGSGVPVQLMGCNVVVIPNDWRTK